MRSRVYPPGVRGAYSARRERPVVFAQAGHRVHYLDGSRADVDILPPIGGPETILAGGEYLRLVFDTSFFTHLGSLYNRQAAMAVGFYTADLSSSDMDSFLRLALTGEVLILNTVAGYWVQHGGNASSGLGLDDLAPNVRIFRNAARLAVRGGKATWGQLEGPLTRYEAVTLVHLFGTMIGKSVRGPTALIRLVAISLAINPRLLWEKLFVAGCLRFVHPLGRMALVRATRGWPRPSRFWPFRPGERRNHRDSLSAPRR